MARVARAREEARESRPSPSGKGARAELPLTVPRSPFGGALVPHAVPWAGFPPPLGHGWGAPSREFARRGGGVARWWCERWLGGAADGRDRGASRGVASAPPAAALGRPVSRSTFFPPAFPPPTRVSPAPLRRSRAPARPSPGRPGSRGWLVPWPGCARGRARGDACPGGGPRDAAVSSAVARRPPAALAALAPCAPSPRRGGGPLGGLARGPFRRPAAARPPPRGCAVGRPVGPSFPVEVLAPPRPRPPARAPRRSAPSSVPPHLSPPPSLSPHRVSLHRSRAGGGAVRTRVPRAFRCRGGGHGERGGGGAVRAGASGPLPLYPVRVCAVLPPSPRPGPVRASGAEVSPCGRRKVRLRGVRVPACLVVLRSRARLRGPVCVWGRLGRGRGGFPVGSPRLFPRPRHRSSLRVSRAACPVGACTRSRLAPAPPRPSVRPSGRRRRRRPSRRSPLLRDATSDQTWRPAEFKHISQRRKRN